MHFSDVYHSKNFPDGLKEIGETAFSGNSGWKDRPSETNLIEEVILTDSVEMIGTRAFAYCENTTILNMKRSSIIRKAEETNKPLDELFDELHNEVL